MPRKKATVSVKRSKLLDGLITKGKKLKTPIGAALRIPLGGADPTVDALEWVLYQEFGTATRRRGKPFQGVAGKTEEYPIPSLETIAKDGGFYMKFPDPEEKYNFPHKDGEAIVASGKNPSPTPPIYHPGVWPKSFIRDTLAQEGLESFKTLAVEIKDTIIPIGKHIGKGVDVNEDLQIITLKKLREIKELIALRMEAVLEQTRDDGRLEGQDPAEVFRSRVTVIRRLNKRR